MPYLDYESEEEDQPRIVLDPGCEFRILNADPPLTGSFSELNQALSSLAGKAVIALRPVPFPVAVGRATSAMGQGRQHGVWMGTPFTPPDADTAPDFMFLQRLVNTPERRTLKRFCIRRRFVPAVCSSLKTMMIYTDGACSDNGSATRTPRGGSAFVFNHADSGTVGFALEKKGPDGEAYLHTSNRAELRAVIAALTFRGWWGEGWERIIIVTDSEYVGKGATEWLGRWAARGWRTSTGRPVANRDLWEALSEALGTFAESGCEISFWMVRRQWNHLADTAAKDAATQCDVSEKYLTPSGVLI